ncbi:MAG TPA: MFS transporter [Polyangia bacterium]|jgi:MFS family permease|nr:MFS transporter [Polyangia bacterium]
MSQVASPVPHRHDPFAPLRVKSFRWFIVSVMTMAMGAQVQGLVVAWQMYAITHDPLSLGMVGLAEAAPFIGLALLAGHVADVVDRRKVALAALAVLGGCAGLLAVLSGTIAAQAGDHALLRWGIYGVIVLCGVARSFLLPARNALSAEVVTRDLYAQAVAWRGGSWQVSAVTGPALGGLLFAWVGAKGAYLIAAALMATSFLAVWRIAVPARTRPAASVTLLDSLREGLAFLIKRRLFLGAMTLDLLAVLFGGAVAILPVFADSILHVGPQGLGMLRAAPAVGAVAVSIFLALRPPTGKAGPTFLAAVALFGLCMISFALSRTFWFSLVVLAVSGGADMLSIFVRSTMMQVMVPTHMLGRISSVNQIFVGSSNEIGAFESGVAARLLGTVTSVVVGGAITVGVVGLISWRVPELRRLKKIEAEA